jgi:hypothetical protein
MVPVLRESNSNSTIDNRRIIVLDLRGNGRLNTDTIYLIPCRLFSLPINLDRPFGKETKNCPVRSSTPFGPSGALTAVGTTKNPNTKPLVLPTRCFIFILPTSCFIFILPTRLCLPCLKHLALSSWTTPREG